MKINLPCYATYPAISHSVFFWRMITKMLSLLMRRMFKIYLQDVCINDTKTFYVKRKGNLISNPFKLNFQRLVHTNFKLMTKTEKRD